MAVSAGTVANGSPGASARYGGALVVLATVFFMWGFATVLNDILVPHLKAVFALNYGQSLLIQFVFYLAYLLISLPAAGGALAYFQGVLADHVGLQLSYLLPAACYVYVLFYAVWGSRVRETLPKEELTT